MMAAGDQMRAVLETSSLPIALLGLAAEGGKDGEDGKETGVCC